MRALVAGAEGQLGRDLVAQLGSQVAWSGGRAGLDVTHAADVERLLREVQPDVVFNAAAYNAVDAAESDAGLAYAVNAAGPAHLARACGATGALLVHVSSDYVFDGRRQRPYEEDDIPAPLSQYGASKRAGELAVLATTGRHLIVRTSAVFGHGGSRTKGGSFVDRILARARSGVPLRVVDDQVFAPTYAPDLAGALIALAQSSAEGLLHVTNGGSCSWHELARTAVAAAGLTCPVEAIGSAELGARARRPAQSVLSGARFAALGHAPLRPWREALAALLVDGGAA